MGMTSGKSVGLSGGSFVRLGRITSGAEGVEIGSVSLTGGIDEMVSFQIVRQILCGLKHGALFFTMNLYVSLKLASASYSHQPQIDPRGAGEEVS